MKIVRNVLIAFGGLFVLLVVFVVYIAASSTSFFEENLEFAEQFTHDFAKDWEIENVYARSTNTFIHSVSEGRAREILHQFRSLGDLERLYEPEMGRYESGTSGTTGIITFKAEFTNTKAVIVVTLLEKDGVVKVQGFRVSPTEEVLPKVTEQEA